MSAACLAAKSSGSEALSNMKSGGKQPKTLSEAKTLPGHAPDKRRQKGRAAEQSDRNVERAKHWVDEHKS